MFDRLQLTLVVSALVTDILVLLAITSRITEWGFGPNKSAALGENLILLANLAWSGWLFLGVIRGTVPFACLARARTADLHPVRGGDAEQPKPVDEHDACRIGKPQPGTTEVGHRFSGPG
jgi:hypothetical protein